ncbi:MAG TPA: ribosome biogenesis/translation initiation ATPase RLI [Candidatus Hodarchaeales archaeon]|nr:ribosome biogenesis/translation initiation ATPase RLI [Candidatus Hodarchaeales archaeon]
MRLAVIDQDKCKPTRCAHECQKACPVERAGSQLFFFDPNDPKKMPLIAEDLCIGCGLCQKCRFGAVYIVNTPETVDSEMIHRYGDNGFALFRLPVLQKHAVTGLVGQNGTGKSTALKILAGEMKPNFGKIRKETEWDEIVEFFKGTESQYFFQKMADEELKCVRKPQYIDRIGKMKGTANELFKKFDDKGNATEVRDDLAMEPFWNREISVLSGGELQKVAIGIALIREADIYLFDEPSSFLDISERLRMARAIRRLKEEKNKTVIVAEHDLAVLDYLSDYISVHYGEPAAYGIVTKPHGVREGINIFLNGYVPEENVRFRTESIKIDKTSIRESSVTEKILLSFPDFEKKYENFSLQVKAGQIREGEVIGILGANGTGKTTFVKILAGLEKTSNGALLQESELSISYKPQYLVPPEGITAEEFIRQAHPSTAISSTFKSEVLKPFNFDTYSFQEMSNLSGGELQKAFIAATLAKPADLYLFDEPSAYLSVEDRLMTAKVIHRVLQRSRNSGFIVEHDIVFQDYVSDSLMVFLGSPGQYGKAYPPTDLEKGMNRFLANIQVSFRRDSETGRPRVNKTDSRLDKEQKAEGRYYYS